MALIQARCHANDHTVSYESSRTVRSRVVYSTRTVHRRVVSGDSG